ncbi:uncharacterized protein [Rutidosis leptorrhynchoides]|uniref:uncharacterized protein n=1 Tax=Rutidosis leptorrhynchoides TaxID=125765 RepID=UPI003A99D0BE
MTTRNEQVNEDQGDENDSKAKVEAVVKPSLAVKKRFANLRVEDLEGFSGNFGRRDLHFKNFKLSEPPMFHGERDPHKSTCWITDIEWAFRTSECPLDKKTRYGSSMLRDNAKLWWNGKVQVYGEEQCLSLTWEEFEEELFKEYRTQADLSRIRDELRNLEQGSMGLNELKRGSVDSFERLFEVARGFETLFRRRSGFDDSKRKFEATFRSNKSSKSASEGVGSVKSGSKKDFLPACYNCGQRGHLSRDCTSTPSNKVTCFRFQKEGHRNSECPKLVGDARVRNYGVIDKDERRA